MLNSKLNMPAAVISIGIHTALLLTLSHITPSPRIISDQRDELYLVNLVTPEVYHIPLETVKQQKHTHFKPQLNPAGNLVHTLNSRPLAFASTKPSESKKMPFSPNIKTSFPKQLAYERIAANPLPQSRPKELVMLHLNPSTQKTSLSKSPSPPLPKKQAKITQNTEPSNELLTYQQAIVSKILSSKIYPINAQKRGQEGVICLRFLLSKDGQLKDIEFANTSPYKLLNQAAIDTIKRASPFQPLPDSSTKEELWVKLSLSFTLDR